MEHELFGHEVYHSILEIQFVVDAWTQKYNTMRVHRSLNGQTPAAYAKMLKEATPYELTGPKVVVADESRYQRCSWTSRDHPGPLLTKTRTSENPSQVLDQNRGGEHQLLTASHRRPGQAMTATENSAATIPNDDPSRSLTVVNPEDPDTTYIALAGDNYAMLIGGDQTDGRYCLIDMRVPDGGGPPPHRHNFEEMFTILEGEITFTFRGEERTVSAGSTVNIPANAPHFFRNKSGAPARMLCMCTPAGQEEYFLRVGHVVDGPESAAPELSPEEEAAGRKFAVELAAQYQTEMLI